MNNQRAVNITQSRKCNIYCSISCLMVFLLRWKPATATAKYDTMTELKFTRDKCLQLDTVIYTWELQEY